MKKLKNTVTLIIVTTMVFSCSTPENRAKRLIKEYGKENIGYQDSYKPLDFGELDSVFLWDVEWDRYVDKRTNYMEQWSNAREKYNSAQTIEELNYYNDKWKIIGDSLKYYMKKLDQLDSVRYENRKKDFYGYKMKHRYGFKNSDLLEKEITVEYLLNKDLTEIIDTKHIAVD